MGNAHRSLVVLLAALASLLLAQPVLADGRGHTVFGQEYTLAEGERLSGDLVMLGGSARLLPDSVVDGNVTVIGGEVIIEGHVRGDVAAVGGTLELGAGAEVEGDMVSFGNVRRHPEAIVRGELVTGPDAAQRFDALARMFDGRVAPPPRPTVPDRPADDLSWLGALARQVLTLGTALAAAALIAALFPAHLARVSQAMTSAWLQSAGVGVLTAVVAVVLAPVLAITCIGLPVSFVILISLAAAVLLGWAGAGQRVGARMARVANLRLTSMLAQTILGVALITLVAMLPCLGLLVGLAVAVWGLGAVALTRFGTRDYVPTVLAPEPEGRVPGTPAAPRGDTHPLNTPPGAKGEGEGR
jgi:hypothetical protein